MKSSYLIIIVAVILIIIVGLVCFKFGYISGKKSLESTVAQYKKVIDYYNPILEEVFSVSGKITGIENKTLSIETIIQDPYVLPNERKTKIIKVIVTDESELSKFDMSTGEQIKISLSDLRVEDEIRARANENIKDKIEFEAISVELYVMPE